MGEKTTNIIFWALWAFLFLGLWVIASLHNGTEGEWWSMLVLEPGEYGPMAFKLSYIKIVIAATLSIVVAYIINSLLRTAKGSNSL